MNCDHYVEGKFVSFDYTFCISKKCPLRNSCARNLDMYDTDKKKKQRYFSMANFNKEEVNERKNN